jgi:tetratricopeptide (TPR) repeat protein
MNFSATAAEPFPESNEYARLRGITKEIEKTPTNAKLYLKRAEQFRQQREWKKSLLDYAKAAALDPSLVEVDRERAKLFLRTGRNQEASEAIARFLSNLPDDPEGIVIQGRILMGLGKFGESAASFTKAIQLGFEPAPDLYLERLSVQERDPAVKPAQKLAGLDEGIRKLGSIPSLELKAIELERSSGNLEGALSRIDGLLGKAEAKELWLEHRADLLVRMKRRSEARDALKTALQACETRAGAAPPNAERLKLRARLSRKLAAISAKPERNLATTDP